MQLLGSEVNRFDSQLEPAGTVNLIRDNMRTVIVFCSTRFLMHKYGIKRLKYEFDIWYGDSPLWKKQSVNALRRSFSI